MKQFLLSSSIFLQLLALMGHFHVTVEGNNVICKKPNQWYHICGANLLVSGGRYPADQCPFTCENDTVFYQDGYKIPNTRGCRSLCVTGCRCKYDYYDDGNGNCVQAKDCPMPVQCGANEKYVRSMWPHCEKRSCNNLLKNLQCLLPKTFLEPPGCVCKHSFVRADNGSCISIEDCPTYPPKCTDPRKEFKTCGSACPPSCAYIGKSRTCMDMCISGCFCKDPYVMEFSAYPGYLDSKCVLPDECSKSN